MVKQTRKNCLFLYFHLIIVAIAAAQQFPFRAYLEKHGLPSPIIRCIYQDSKGYLWVGTGNGLCRFDGVEFKAMNEGKRFSDDRINVILEDHNGNVWIGEGNGRIRCLNAKGLERDASSNNSAGRSIYDIKEDSEGRLWFATSKGLFVFNGKVFSHIHRVCGLDTSVIFAIAFDHKGKVWLGTDKGLGRFETNGLKKLTVYSSKTGLLEDSINTLLFTSEGKLWIGTAKGLNVYHEGGISSYTTQDGLCHNSVTALMEDNDGNIWAGTWKGVTIFSCDGKTINIETANGLPNNFIYNLLQDKEGNIWFGTHGGVSCLTSWNIKTYTKEEGLLNDMVTDTVHDKEGRYWFATLEGLSCYHKGIVRNYTTNDGLVGNTINDLMADSQGNIWIATTEGLSIFTSGSFSNYKIKDGLGSNILFNITEGRDGTVWIASKGGLTCFKNSVFTAPPFELNPAIILHITEDSRGDLWFASPEHLYRYSKNKLTTFTSENGFEVDSINALYESRDGKIWIGSLKGLTCFSVKQLTGTSNPPSYLYRGACRCIMEDNQGRIWIGTSDGIAVYDGKKFDTYTFERMGLTDRTWISGSRDRKGNLWFSGSEGATSFFPPPVKRNTVAPPVYITGVKVMEKEISMTDTPRFPYDRNIFRFNFAGLSYTVPTGVQYKYRLDGIDEDWRVTKDRSLFYPFLPAGSYNLMVKAINCDGVESVQPANYRFKILPPFWRTWWFHSFIIFIVILLVAVALHWRTRRALEKAEKEARKKELAARNVQLVMAQRMELMGLLAAGTVHDLKNLLAVIIGYSQVIGDKYQGENGDHEDSHNIGIIKETAATAVQMAKQILAFAGPKNHASQEPVNVQQEVADILDTLKVTHFKAIQVQWQPPPEPVYLNIHPVHFQQLVMNLYLNACDAMPHGGTLNISLYSGESNEVVLDVSDSGNGMDEDQLTHLFNPLFTTKEQGKGTGLGLFVVKQIVDEYQGDIDVTSVPGRGSRFIIRFPAHL